MLPSRFVASASANPREPTTDACGNIEDVRCVVALRDDSGVRELIVGSELGGALRVVEATRDELPPRARAQLAYHDVAASGRVLELACEELYLFDLQVIEMLPDAPGLNDVLYLYGAIRGPWPAVLGRPAAAIDGQLAVTRADLLSGLVDGVARAFTYAPTPAGSRCVHALLPGESAAEIDAGRGVVLALPLVPAWTLDAEVPNDRVAAQVFYDVASAVRADLDDQGPLPTPDRAALEHKLRAEGWQIDGDRATRAKRGGVLGSLLAKDERALPRQGTLEDFVAEATALLARMPGMPTPETAALRRRAVPVRSQPATPIDQTARVTTPAPPPPSTSPRPRVTASRSDWMKDFIDAHRDAQRPAPRVAAPARAVSKAAVADWMSDFAAPDDDERDDAPAPKPPPDWSKDFEP